MKNTVLLNKDNAVATITFNRPDAMNAFNHEMADEFQNIIQEVKSDPTIRAIQLSGAGDLFMAGGDIEFFYKNLEQMPAGVKEIINQVNQTITAIREMEKPVLACVHGAVAGIGISFMLACDLVIAAEDTKFTLAYSGIGTSPDGGASYNLPRLVGSKKAMELLLLSERFDAQTAKSLGLINWTAPKEQVFEKANEILQRLANGPTKAYANIKRLVNNTWENDFNTHLEQELTAFANCTETEDFKSGVKAFLKKEKPEFVGR